MSEKYSFTGLERGDAEDIKALLDAYNDDMNQIVKDLQKLANILDNHADDTLSSGLLKSFESFFDNIRISMNNIVEITDESIYELEKKNDVLHNKFLADDIDMLRAASARFLNGIVFNADLLNGSDTVKDEELSDIGIGLKDMSIDWTNYIASAKRRAVDKADAYVQNEMSPIFKIIMDSLDMLNRSTEELIIDIIHQNFKIQDAYNARAGKMKGHAESSIESSSKKIKSAMEQIVDEFASIDFFGGI